MIDDLFYAVPKPTEADWEAYASAGFEPLFFEWYKFVMSVVNLVSALRPDSPAFKSADPRHYYVLSGLLHRCVRLMMANLALTHEGSFGETAAIIDRCIGESCLKVQWLTLRETHERIVRYLQDSLRPELEFEAEIEANIAARAGDVLPIEARMLKSINAHISAAGVTRSEIKGCKKLPDMAAILKELGHRRLSYVIIQRMGSHHVHGTWPSLLSHYLSATDEVPGYTFAPRHGTVSMHINNYVFDCVLALEATQSYSNYFLQDDEAEAFSTLCSDTLDEITSHYHRALGYELDGQFVAE